MHAAKCPRVARNGRGRGTPTYEVEMPTQSTLLDRALRRVLCDARTRCWEWTGFREKGYGKMMMPKPRKRPVPVHRFVYEALVGPIPDGLVLDHLCQIGRPSGREGG